MKRTMGVLPKDPADRQSRAERESGLHRERLLLFDVAGETLGVSLAFLREVAVPEGIQWDPEGPTRDVEGFVHRGLPIPAVHLGTLLGYPATSRGEAPRVIVGETPGCRFGLVVDGVREVVEVLPQAILPLPVGVSRLPAACFRGLWCRGDQVVLILDERGLAALGGVERFGEAVGASVPVRARGGT